MEIMTKSLRPASTPTPALRSLVDAAKATISNDLLRRWTVKELESELALSQRGFQRYLANQGTTFSNLIANEKLMAAAVHLQDKDGPSLAEIGFLAGFADQSHFTRTFTRAIGTTPSSYREDFGTSGD